jgi:quinolinate synthase
MAESADVLSAEHQQVILPDLAAGCSMADMADSEQLEIAWADLEEMLRGEPASAQKAAIVPVTYINSSAAIKAFCGAHGGVVCTSSNAAATMVWARERGERVLFLPDQHLGRNTAYAMGIPLDEMAVWDPNEVQGGLTADEVRRARIILWKGHCSVHTRFTARQIQQVRAQHPGVRVIVHPEVPWEVVQAADDAGSTEYIIRQVTASPPGSVWAVGTEIHLVNRLADEVAPERTVLSLDQFGCLCSTMFRVSPNHLLWILDGLLAGEVHNRIVVPPDQKHWTKVALDRMLSIS